jgi:glutathione synthase
LAHETPERFVLKPQREGGGNNVYRADIPPFLAQLDEADRNRAAGYPRAREGWILMDLIQPPDVSNIMVPAGQGRAIEGTIISELGVYGTILYRARPDGTGAEILHNEQVGHLLRTKASNVSEGGVATGFSVLDSPLLV